MTAAALLFADSTAVNAIPRRNPTGALLRSAVVPGWGQFYNDEPLKGLAYGALQAGLLGWTLYENHQAIHSREMFELTGDPEWDQSGDDHRDQCRSLVWYTAGAWVASMLDAYVDAWLFGFDAENRAFESDAGLALMVGIGI